MARLVPETVLHPVHCFKHYSFIAFLNVAQNVAVSLRIGGHAVATGDVRARVRAGSTQGDSGSMHASTSEEAYASLHEAYVSAVDSLLLHACMQAPERGGQQARTAVSTAGADCRWQRQRANT